MTADQAYARATQHAEAAQYWSVIGAAGLAALGVALLWWWLAERKYSSARERRFVAYDAARDVRRAEQNRGRTTR